MVSHLKLYRSRESNKTIEEEGQRKRDEAETDKRKRKLGQGRYLADVMKGRATKRSIPPLHSTNRVE